MRFALLFAPVAAAQAVSQASPATPNSQSQSGNGMTATAAASSASSSMAPSGASSGGAGGSSGAGGAAPAQPSTAIPSSSDPPDTPVPGQGVYPPPQWWCTDNATYCPGKLLQDVQLAGIFPDSKTFVDKPTKGTLNDTLNIFNNLGTNVTIGSITQFVEQNFKGEGLELEEVQIQGLPEEPKILDNITDPIFHAWVKVVNSYWSLLVRQTNQSALCQPGPDGCSSSLIPLNHTIVVPGGRYHEIYYWDSFWIHEGLLASELYNYAWNLLQNFMDIVETYGFLPNGGRKYYLNRSQPPVFVQMVHQYVQATGNKTILDRALPLLEAEMQWWHTNRTLNVTSPWTNKTHTVGHFAVINSAPRPEGYVEDYEAAFGAEPKLNESQRSDLYAELATGAESGWDYTARWCREPLLNDTDNLPALRTLNVRKILPVDLNALLSSNHALLADLYEMQQGGNASGSGGGGQQSGGGEQQSGGGEQQSGGGEQQSGGGEQSGTSQPSGQPSGTEQPTGSTGGATPAPSPSDTAGGSESGSATIQTDSASSPSPSANTEAGAGDASATPSPTSAGSKRQLGPPPAESSTADQGGGQAAPQTSTTWHSDTSMPGSAPASSEMSTSAAGGASPSGNQTATAAGTTSAAPSDKPTAGNATDRIAFHREKAKAIAEAIMDLHWDAEKAYFYDFNMTENKRTDVYHAGGLWPLWLNITPPGLEGNETMALAIASGQRFLLGKYAGPPAISTLLKTGLNWDFPNVWPNHVYTTIRAFETLGRMVPNATVLPNITVPFSNVSAGQLGLAENELQPQPVETIGNTSLSSGTTGKPWPELMAIEVAYRYMTDAFCSWYSTGGSIPGVLEQLPISDLNQTGTYTADQAGHMFEKFNATDPDAAGGGGEYKVQVGFGWTNGVVLWIAGRYGQYLPAPTCPLIPIVVGNATTGGGAGGNNGTTGGGNGTTGGQPSHMASQPIGMTSGASAASSAAPSGPPQEPQNGTQSLFRGYRIAPFKRAV